MNIRRAIMSLFIVGLFTGTSFAEPFKVLRAVTSPNGTFFVGGGGFTVTRTAPGHYHVVFPKGTWNRDSSTACFFVPQVQSLFTTSVAEIAGWFTLGDGSGVADVVIASGADAPLTMIFVSANC